MNILAWIFSILATFSQSTPPPAEFVFGLMNKSHTQVIPETLVGSVWNCGDEECYAGLIKIDNQWTLQTGP